MTDPLTPHPQAVEIVRREAYEEYGRAKTWENGVFNCQRFSEHALRALIAAGYAQLAEEPKK